MRWAALFTTLITLPAGAGAVAVRPATGRFQFVEKYPWLGGATTYPYGRRRHFAAVRILTTGADAPHHPRPAGSCGNGQGIYGRVPGAGNPDGRTFAALDLVLFYLFFEGGLIPMFLIIGAWAVRAASMPASSSSSTPLGSVLMLFAIMAMYWHAGTSDIASLTAKISRAHATTCAGWAFFASFAVKMPMWPVHTCLPDAHVEAPTAGSVSLRRSC